ncbi:FAD-binding protein [Nocardioides sp.]|uniref:FAD-binding protein n=1 Tax=Nocardioides sp. TaxID=35761 RepID=UPI00262E757D|nr:FAD-binding protein [Nocardioides sp.]
MSTEIHHDLDCDMLVVGSGGGALTGALIAASRGLRVIVAEASEYFGGTTAYSGGGMWLPLNAVLRRDGNVDSAEAVAEYFHSIVGDRTPRDLQDAFLDNGAPLVDELEKLEPMAFQQLPWPDYFGAAPSASAHGRHIIPQPLTPEELGALRDVLRPPLGVERAGQELPPHVGGGQALIGRLLLALDRFDNVTLLANATCDELLVDGGRVAGAVVETAEGRVRINAAKGVLIAAGGFERNQELREQYGVPGNERDSMGAPANVGKALTAALAVGADTDLMDQAWWSPGITHPDGTSSFSLWLTGGIFVDGQGRRFVNESWPYDRLGRAIIDLMDAGEMSLPFWFVYDDRDGVTPPVRATSVPVGDAADYQAAGLWHSADTLEELAATIGVPAQTLVETVARFNELAAAEKDDDFGRGDEPYDRAFSGGKSPLVPVEKGPFHAAAFGISDLGTKGGLRTDAAARVLDAQGQVIEGLYAAGNSQAAVSGYVYPGGGNPIGACMVFSYLAALDMAGESGR